MQGTIDERFDRMAQALERMARTQLLELLARPGVAKPIRDTANELLKEIDASGTNDRKV